jgi:hypothetical protein
MQIGTVSQIQLSKFGNMRAVCIVAFMEAALSLQNLVGSHLHASENQTYLALHCVVILPDISLITTFCCCKDLYEVNMQHELTLTDIILK